MTAAPAGGGLAEVLEQTARDLAEHRQTHVVWRDWLLKDPANAAVNPHAGSAEFHDNTIKDYDRHLANIVAAVNYLRSHGAAIGELIEAVKTINQNARPANWEDSDDQEQRDAWIALDAALAKVASNGDTK